jgi:hypothetical protein
MPSKTPTPAINFNADENKKKRSEGVITIGGREFHPVAKTVALMDQIAQDAPEVFGKALDREKDPTRELHLVNVQVNALIADSEGKSPGMEFLNDELDLEDGYTLLNMLAADPTGEKEKAQD